MTFIQTLRDKELGIMRVKDVAFVVGTSEEVITRVLKETTLVPIKPDVLMTAEALIRFIGEDNNEVLSNKMQALHPRGTFGFRGKKGGSIVNITRHTENLYSAEKIR